MLEVPPFPPQDFQLRRPISVADHTPAGPAVQGLAEIKPQAPGRAPWAGGKLSMETGVQGEEGPPCPPGFPFTPAAPLVLPTVRQERGQRQVHGKNSALYSMWSNMLPS